MMFMQSKRLQLNTSKTELLWCTTHYTRRQHLLPRSALRVGIDTIIPRWLRDLDIFIDADLTMRPHVQRTVAGCFDVLRQLRSIRRSIIYAPNAGRHPCAVQAAGTTVNATLAGFRSTYLIVYNLSSTLLLAVLSRLLVCDDPTWDHSLNRRSCQFSLVASTSANRLTVIVYRAVHGTASRYLSDLLCRVADVPPRRCLRSSTYRPTLNWSRIGRGLYLSMIVVICSCCWSNTLGNSLPEDLRRLYLC